MIKREGSKYKLYTSDGSRVLGTHDSRKNAIKQEQAIQISKYKKSKSKLKTSLAFSIEKSARAKLATIEVPETKGEVLDRSYTGTSREHEGRRAEALISGVEGTFGGSDSLNLGDLPTQALEVAGGIRFPHVSRNGFDPSSPFRYIPSLLRDARYSDLSRRNKERTDRLYKEHVFDRESAGLEPNQDELTHDQMKMYNEDKAGQDYSDITTDTSAAISRFLRTIIENDKK